MRTHVNFVRAASRDYVFGLELTAPGQTMQGSAGSVGSREELDPTYA
jgi:hypothetical protein